MLTHISGGRWRWELGYGMKATATLFAAIAVLAVAGCTVWVKREHTPSRCRLFSIGPDRTVATEKIFDRESGARRGGQSFRYVGLKDDKLMFEERRWYLTSDVYVSEHDAPAKPDTVLESHDIGFAYSIRIVSIEGEDITYYLEPAQGCSELSD